MSGTHAISLSLAFQNLAFRLLKYHDLSRLFPELWGVFKKVLANDGHKDGQEDEDDEDEEENETWDGNTARDRNRAIACRFPQRTKEKLKDMEVFLTKVKKYITVSTCYVKALCFID